MREPDPSSRTRSGTRIVGYDGRTRPLTKASKNSDSTLSGSYFSPGSSDVYPDGVSHSESLDMGFHCVEKVGQVTIPLVSTPAFESTGEGKIGHIPQVVSEFIGTRRSHTGP